MICESTIAQMKDGVKIINLARAELVNGADIAAAMESGKVGAYVVDFPTEETVAIPGALTIPHLGASTEESEDNCAVMAAIELDEYLRLGNIRNSVNYPNVSMPVSGTMRVCVLHANIPAVLTNVASVLQSAASTLRICSTTPRARMPIRCWTFPRRQVPRSWPSWRPLAACVAQD